MDKKIAKNDIVTNIVFHSVNYRYYKIPFHDNILIKTIKSVFKRADIWAKPRIKSPCNRR